MAFFYNNVFMSERFPALGIKLHELQQQAVPQKLLCKCKKNEILFSKEYFNQYFSTLTKINSVAWLLLDIFVYNYETA